MQYQTYAVETVGFLAGLLTTAANVPQVITTYRHHSGKGLSFRMLLILCVGLAMWVAYGVLHRAWPLIIFNSISLVLAVALMVMKFRYDRHPAAE